MRWAVVIAVIAAVGAAVFQSWRAESGAGGVPDGWVQTQFGPLGPGDRELLYKVRLAGLWEMPTGQEMQQRATNPKVREVGGKIAAEHVELDGIVRDTAAKLNVMLPNQPSDEQQGWMREISAATGSDYDVVAVNRLRAAHGKVLPLISQVRAGTRNDLVRKLALTAATFVGRHHEYLESTGLVDYSALPAPPEPGAAGQPTPAGIDQTGLSLATQMGTAAAVFFAAVLGIVGLLSLLRRGRRPRVLPPDLVHVPEPRQPLAITAPQDRRARHAARRW